MRKPWRGIALAASAALVVAGCGGDDENESGSDVSEVVIGVLDPTSGSNATSGLDSQHGVELAAEIINGDYPDLDLPLAEGEGLPNLNNATIKLVFGDTESDPEKGATEAERLITDEGAIALTGAYNSSVTLTASERAERLEVPFVNGDSSSTALTERGLDWFFRTGPHDQTFGEAFFSMLKQMQGNGMEVQDVAIVHTNDEFGSNGADVTEQLAVDNGFNVVKKLGYDSSTQDLTPIIQQVRDADPDVMFALSYIKDSLLMAETFEKLDYYPPAVLGYGSGFADPAFYDSPEEAARIEGFTRRTSWSSDLAENNPAAKFIADMFQEKYDLPMTENSARTFTAMMTLALAIDEAGTTDNEKIRSALKNIDIPGRDTIMPWDGVRFDDNQQNEGAKGVVEQFASGDWQIVYPTEVASKEVTFPLPMAADNASG